jgi:hypothetical protein
MAEYSLFDRQTGRPMCVGNGETCKRVGLEGLQSLPCPSPSGCDYGAKAGCKPYGRLNVQIEGMDDAMGSFIFRTTGFNSIRTIAARLSYFQAVSGGLLACMPLAMKLRAKSTTQSHRAPVYYVDISTREGMTLEQTITEAKELHDQRIKIGHDQGALDSAAKIGFENGAFEETEEDTPEVLEEFFSEQTEGTSTGTGAGAATKGKPSLQEKLEHKAQANEVTA